MKISNVSKKLLEHKMALFSEMPNLKCAICSNPLLKKTEVDKFILRVCGQNSSRPSVKSISVFMDTLTYQKADTMELLNLMEHYAKLYPDKSFGEIFGMPEVLKPHLRNAHNYYLDNYVKSRPIFELMEKNLQLTPEQKEKLAALHKKAINISIGRLSDPVKRYLIMQNYATFQSEIGGVGAAQLVEYSKKIPLYPASPDLALCHMAGKTDAHIMQGLLAPTTPMLKKINRTDGHGIFLCQKCNTEAGYVPFATLFTLFPQLFENIQRQLNTIISALSQGHLRGHGDYPKVLQKLVFEATGGKKVLDLSKYRQLRYVISQKASRPATNVETAELQMKKAKKFERMLLRETPDKVKNFLVFAEKQKQEMLARPDITPDKIKKHDEYINRLRKIYIQLLRRDKLI